MFVSRLMKLKALAVKHNQFNKQHSGVYLLHVRKKSTEFGQDTRKKLANCKEFYYFCISLYDPPKLAIPLHVLTSKVKTN